MNLEQAIANPRINVFDIVTHPNGVVFVHTYRKPKEKTKAMDIRQVKNKAKAFQLKTKKP